ncbi:MAG TPA: LytTR family DNA-binding domain-containing protein [Gemmatimonadales bacterium]
MRVLIVDDEPLARRGLRQELARFPAAEIVGECANGLEAVQAVVERAPDLVLLDVQMPGLNGFDVIERVGADAMPAVIFVTAYDRHALRAFEVHALDYVLKPIDPDRFRDAMERASASLARRDLPGSTGDRLEAAARMGATQSRSGTAAPPLSRVVVQEGGKLCFLETTAIDWIEAAGNYVRLHAGTREHLIRGPLARFAARLGTERFVRIRRSALVNVRAITSLERYGKASWTVSLRSGSRLVSSRYYVRQIRALLE